MKRLLTIVSLLLIAASRASAQQNYCWTLSTSNVDPGANAGPVSGPPFSMFLWLALGSPGGMSAAEFDLSVPAGMSNFGFTAMNGFLNAGGSSNLLLAVGGCPQGPVVAGQWTLFGQAAGQICLVNSAANGIRVTVDCDPINPQAWPIDAVGYGYGTVASCVDLCVHGDCYGWFCDPEFGCYVDLCACGSCQGPEICATCPPVAVEPTTWGRTKSLYR